MASLNRAIRTPEIFTHGGTTAVKISKENQLRRSVLSCLLWEDEFYEDGQEIAKRIQGLAAECSSHFVYELAMEARHIHGLRHVPLLLILSLLKRKDPVIIKEDQAAGIQGVRVKHAIANIIRRPDEMAELLTMYWHLGNENKKKPKGQGHLADRQLRDGLALAFAKFDEYSLAKYDHQGRGVTMRDVMFLSHPKPRNEAQAVLFKKVAEKKLTVPDTWEVALTRAGSDPDAKKAAWTRLAENTVNLNFKDRDGRLGYMAVLRNIRNMEQAGVDPKLIRECILLRRGADLVFPYRYIAAAKHNPKYEDELNTAFLDSFSMNKIEGKTILIVDISGSMGAGLSYRSEMRRIDAACAIAALAREAFADVRIYATAGDDWKKKHATGLVPNRRGFALMEAIPRMNRELGGGGVFTRQCLEYVEKEEKTADRLILFTDEQDTSGERATKSVVPFAKINYLVNVASARNGVGYGHWIHLDGFSDGILKYIQAIEELGYK